MLHYNSLPLVVMNGDVLVCLVSMAVSASLSLFQNRSYDLVWTDFVDDDLMET